MRVSVTSALFLALSVAALAAACDAPFTTGSGGSSSGTGGGTGPGSSSGASTGGGGGDGGVQCHDNDGDGVTDCAGDCDDDNEDIRPGALELCGDGIDNDCNGEKDDVSVCKGKGAFVSETTGNDNNPGTAASPVKTLYQGIQNAIFIGNGTPVVVANGKYQEDVTLIDEISMYGGFDPGTWQQDNTAESVVECQSAICVYADATVSDQTAFGGFHVIAKDDATFVVPNGVAGAAVVIDGGAPVIINNIIDGPHETAAGNSYGIYAKNAKGARILLNRKIMGAFAPFGNSAGVRAEQASVIEIEGNIIDGGSGKSSFAVMLEAVGQTSFVKSNILRSGATSGGVSFGIYTSSSPADITGNLINEVANMGASCINLPVGAWCGGINNVASSGTIANNIIHGANSARSTAIWLHNGEANPIAVVVVNNYLDGSNPGASSPTSIAAGVVFTLNTGVSAKFGRLRNNIIEVSGGSSAFGVYEDSAVGKQAHPEAFEFNDLSFPTPPGGFYRIWDGALQSIAADIAAVNGLPGCTSNLNQKPLFDLITRHLMPNSPCIDSGTANEAPADDFEGDSRPQGGSFDIGPDEVAP